MEPGGGAPPLPPVATPLGGSRIFEKGGGRGAMGTILLHKVGGTIRRHEVVRRENLGFC